MARATLPSLVLVKRQLAATLSYYFFGKDFFSGKRFVLFSIALFLRLSDFFSFPLLFSWRDL